MIISISGLKDAREVKCISNHMQNIHLNLFSNFLQTKQNTTGALKLSYMQKNNLIKMYIIMINNYDK